MVVKNKQTKNNLEQKQNSAKIISSSLMQDFIDNNIIITIYFMIRELFACTTIRNTTIS